MEDLWDDMENDDFEEIILCQPTVLFLLIGDTKQLDEIETCEIFVSIFTET